MRIRYTLRQAKERLRAAGVEDSTLEAQILLGHALGVDRARLLMSFGEPISEDQASRFHSLLERRLRREPTAYIIGRKEFYDIELEVTPAAPIPRPETEILVEEALRIAKASVRRPLTIVDVGTGSGAIALTLAKHLPEAKVAATDISHEALTLAKRNAERHTLARRVSFVQCDFIGGLVGPFDAIVANLPYVKTADWGGLAPEIRLYEPRRGFDGGNDGLEHIRRLLVQASAALAPDGGILLEIAWDQGEALRSAVGDIMPGAQVKVEKDLASLDRIVVIRTG